MNNNLATISAYVRRPLRGVQAPAALTVILFMALIAVPFLTLFPAADGMAAQPAQKKTAQKAEAKRTVYDNQPPVTEKELVGFLEILPHFRAWAKENKEEAHPQLRNGKADFLYSPKAAEWVSAQKWDPVRFFCVMGRMAAALVIVEEGNDMSGTRPRDMPSVTEAELALARRHLGAMLKAGGNAPPINKAF